MKLGRLIGIIAARTPSPLRHVMKRNATLRQLYPQPKIVAKSDSKSQASLMLRGLTAGFAEATAANLEPFKLSGDLAEVADAAWGLAQWHVSTGDYGAALDHLTMRRLAQPRAARRPAHLALEVEALLRLGRVEDAERVISNSVAGLGATPQLCFSAANAAALKSGLTQRERDRLRIDWLGKPFAQAGFAMLELRDATRPLAFDNIKAARTNPHPRSGEAKISVLMPAYNAGTTIAVAIESVLNQTWTNIELIVVDDGSKDHTWRVIQSFAERDQRIVAARHEQNRGAYPARNTALRHASGDFVTVNDADDWSHPERLAAQVLGLLDDGHQLNTTRCVRVGPDLAVRVATDGGTFIQNYSSLISRRQVVAALGGWDEVKFGADEELYRRLMLNLDAKANILHRDVPLSLASSRRESLTMQSDVGASTVDYGARREFKEAFAYWHKIETTKQPMDLAMRPGERRFPVPNINRFGSGRRLTYDVLFVADLSVPGGISSTLITMVRATKSAGLRCACFHWPQLDHVGEDVDDQIRRLLHEGLAESVVSGENVACELVIVSNPSILKQRPDRLVEVATRNCVIVFDRLSRTGEGTADFDLERMIDIARTAFGVEPTLAPSSLAMRRILQSESDADLSPVAINCGP